VRPDPSFQGMACSPKAVPLGDFGVAYVMRRIFVLFLFVLPALVSAAPTADLVRVLKSERKLLVLSNGSVLHEFSVALGSNPLGHKTRKGDGKTPEGSYMLDYKKPDSAFHKAIHISYPNAKDIVSARARGVAPGGLIMIHGQKNGFEGASFMTQRFDWTNGCIALSNKDMDTLWSLVKEGTRIEINP
jgi:murein L,D-transpeptidase YafK